MKEDVAHLAEEDEVFVVDLLRALRLHLPPLRVVAQVLEPVLRLSRVDQRRRKPYPLFVDALLDQLGAALGVDVGYHEVLVHAHGHANTRAATRQRAWHHPRQQRRPKRL